MLTLLLIITFTNIRFISGVENNDTTFINSLSDKQKKEFLQKVEKRINEEVPEVKSPEGNDTNVDLYEKQLEDQGKSIQKLLRSEIDSLKSHPRRNSNDSDLSQSAHVDLTLRSHDDETEASRRGSEGKKIPKKSILFENIPVEVQYDSEKSRASNIKNEDVRAEKNESKSDVITWENTSNVTKIVDKNNTSEERKGIGRRSNDLDMSLNKLDTTEDPSSSTNKDTINVTTSYSLTSNNVNSIATTKVDEDFRTKRNSDTSRSIHNVSTATVQELTIQTENKNSRTTQGNKSTTIDAVDSKSVDYSNRTQNNAIISSAINYSTPSIGDGSFNIENSIAISNDAMRTTTSVDKSLRVGDKFNSTTHYTDNSQTKSAYISTTHDSHDKSTTLNNSVTTNVTARNDSVTMGNTAVDVVTSSTIFIKLYTTANRIKTSTFKRAKDIAKIHYISTEANNKYPSFTKDDLNTNNVPHSKKPTAVDEVTYQNHHSTKYDYLIEKIDSQSNSTKSRGQEILLNVNDTVKLLRSNSKLDAGFKKVNKIHDSTTTDNIRTVIYSVLNSTVLGSAKTNSFSKHQSTIVGSNIFDDVEEQPRSTYDSATVANVNETADIQTNITKLGYDKVDKTIIVTGLGIEKEEKIITDTETHYTTTSSLNVNHNNQNKNTIHNDTRLHILHNTAYSQKIKEDNKKSNETLNHSELKVHGAYTIGPNSPVFVNETQPKLVPVYNYDPENAYFNPNIERPANSGIPVVIKQTERHSKTTTLDIYLNGNRQSLRIKDIKERITSAANAKTKQKLDLYDMLSADGSAESAKDEASYEKPLKHSLAKIRKKLYKHKLKSEDNQNNEENTSQNGEDNKRKKYSTVRNKYDEADIIELFKNFGTLFKKEERADDNERSSETKEDSNEGHDLDKEIYKDVANSLENYNKFMKNKRIRQIVETLTKIQSQLAKEKLKNKSFTSIEGYQSRFQVKDRERKHKKEETEVHSIHDHDTPIIVDENLEYGDVKLKPNKIKIEDDYLDLHVNILKDLVNTNDAGLEQYDWLGSTVLIQAGLAKLLETVERKTHHKRLHPRDEELLEFSTNLHQIALTLLAEEYQATPAKRKRLSFRIPKPKKGNKNFNALNRMYGEMKKTRAISLIRSNYGIEDFKEFLDCLGSCLNDFHTAIREVSRITTYKQQHWFKNIKQLYFKPAGEKEYLELLLHLTTARLIGLIEEREKKMGEDDFDNEREADRIGVEFVMTIRICSELERLNQ